MNGASCLGLALALACGAHAANVGYMNITMTPGLNAAAVQLQSSAGGTVAVLLPTVPEGTKLFTLVGGRFGTNVFRSGAWEAPDQPLEIGEGFLLLNPTATPFTVTFTGALLEGRLTNRIGAGLSLAGSMIPKEGGLATALGWPAEPFGNVYLLRAGQWEVFTSLPDGRWAPSEPRPRNGEGFMVRAAKARDWTIEFQANFPAAMRALAVAESSESDGLGTLNLANAAAGFEAALTLEGTGSRPEGSDWTAQLLAEAGGEFLEVGEPAPFQTGALAGYFFGGRRGIPGTSPGGGAMVKIRFAHRSGLARESGAFRVTLGGGILPPANLTGLRSLALPAPLALRIERIESGARVSWPASAEPVVLEAAKDAGGPWQAFGGSKAGDGDRISVSIAENAGAQIFRLRR